MHFSKLDGTYQYITGTSALPDPQVCPISTVLESAYTLKWFVFKDGRA